MDGLLFAIFAVLMLCGVPLAVASGRHYDRRRGAPARFAGLSQFHPRMIRGHLGGATSLKLRFERSRPPF